MKYLLVILSLCIAIPSFANIYCKDESGIKNVLDQDGWMCRDYLTEVGGAYNSCFTGKRATAIDLLNSLEGLGFFEGTDGISIIDAKFKGRDSIAYTILDLANDVSGPGSIERCSSSFFKEK